MYAETLERFSPIGKNVFRNDGINAKIFIERFGKSATKRILCFKDPLDFSKTVFIKNTKLEDDLVSFLKKIKTGKFIETLIFLTIARQKNFGKKNKTFYQGKKLKTLH